MIPELPLGFLFYSLESCNIFHVEENMWSFVEDDFQNVCWKQPKSILASSVADDWEGLPVNKWFEIFFKGGFPNKLPIEALSAGHMFGKMYFLILFTHFIGKYTCEYIKIEFRWFKMLFKQYLCRYFYANTRLLKHQYYVLKCLWSNNILGILRSFKANSRPLKHCYYLVVNTWAFLLLTRVPLKLAPLCNMKDPWSLVSSFCWQSEGDYLSHGASKVHPLLLNLQVEIWGWLWHVLLRWPIVDLMRKMFKVGCFKVPTFLDFLKLLLDLTRGEDDLLVLEREVRDARI